MTCFCCSRSVDVAKKVKIRRLITVVLTHLSTWPTWKNAPIAGQSFAYPCYRNLDSPDGTYLIGEKVFNIASSSRHDKALSISKDKYEQWQKKKASKLGLD